MKSTITVTTRDHFTFHYIAEVQFHSGKGRLLLRAMERGNVMVHIQRNGQDPIFSSYYSDYEGAESYAKWMAKGL